LASSRAAHLVRLLLLAALLGVLLWAPASAQAAAWLPAVPVSPASENATFAEVAMAGNGDVVAAWVQSTGGLWASIRPAGGSFGAPAPVSSGTGNVAGQRPALAADPAGNAVVAWLQSNGTHQLMRAAFRPAGGSFGPPATISAAGQHAANPDLAMDGAGNAIVVWSRSDGTRQRVQWAYRPVGGGFPAGGTTITAGANSSQEFPRIAMDPDGNAVVAYQAYDTPPNVTYIRYQERPAGGVFPGAAGEKEPRLENGNGSGPGSGNMDVGIGGGEMAFVWERLEVGGSTAYRAATRTFGAPQANGTQVLDTSGGMERVHVVMAPSGAAVAAWSTFDGNDVLWSSRAPGAAFTTGQHLAPEAEAADEVAVGLDGLGNAMATWYQLASPASGHTAWAARMPAGQAFGAPQELFGGGSGVFFSSLSAGGDSQGNGFAAAGRFDMSASTTRLNVAGWDPVAPTMGALSVPPFGSNPVSFSVSPFDVWGPVSTGWDFGDGSTATGTEVSHSFATLGRSYNVTATATDAAGNSANASGLTALNGPPTLQALTMLRRVFAIAASPTAIEAQRRRRPKRGTAFRYSVSEPSRVTIGIQRILPGKRVGARCRKPAPRLKRRRSCKRYVRAGRTLVRNVPAGRIRTNFSGRIGRRALRPGRYRATLVATDSAGLRSSPRTITFRVVRR
jgi:hypothetical protein